VPFLADLLFKQGSATDADQSEGKFLLKYKAFLRQVILRRWIAIGSAVALFATSVWGFQFVKEGFFPASTTPQIVVDFWLPQGKDISETTNNMLKIEEELLELEGIEQVQTLIGAGALRYMLVYSPESNNSSYGQFLLKTESYELIADLLPEIQSKLESEYPESQIKAWQFQLGPGGGSKIEAEFSGPDPAVLRKLSEQAKAIMIADGGAISVKDNWRQPVAVVQPVFSDSSARRLGVSREDVANGLQTNFSGRSVGVYREGDTMVPIVLRAPERERLSPSDIGQIQLLSQTTGSIVPLSQAVSSIDTVWRNALLKREDRVWKPTSRQIGV
jgi:multidrug efflux pump subunit AcrB